MKPTQAQSASLDVRAMRLSRVAAAPRPALKAAGSAESADAPPTAPAGGPQHPSEPLRVLVVLPRHLDVPAWSARYAKAEVPDLTPYGYHFARQYGCEVTFARATTTWPGPAGLLDRAVRRLLGFDLRHVWANRDLLDADRFDCIWTHTEFEHLAIGLLRRLRGAHTKFPAVIAQSVWLIDEWPKWSPLRRSLYRALMRDAEAATFLSPLNGQRARELCLARCVEVIEFGISMDSYPALERPPRTIAARSRPLRVMALGNDRHRDWETLSNALGGQPEYELRIGSTTVAPELVRSNMRVGAMTQAQIRAESAWADCVVVPLRANLHASGITAVLESVSLGVPVVATRAGGIDHYFDEDCISYHAVGDAQGLRRAVDELAFGTQRAERQIAAARQRLLDARFSSEGFAWRHAQLSQRLVRRPVATASNPS